MYEDIRCGIATLQPNFLQAITAFQLMLYIGKSFHSLNINNKILDDEIHVRQCPFTVTSIAIVSC